MKIFEDVFKNENELKNRFANCGDVIFRRFRAGKKINMLMVYIDNMVNTEVLENSILKNLMNRTETENYDRNTLKNFAYDNVSVSETTVVYEFEEVLKAVLVGDAAVFAEGADYAVIMSAKKWPVRNVPKTENEVVVQGPKDAFAEAGSTNVVLIRRRIRDADLKVYRTTVGESGNNDIAVMYMEKKARKEVVDGIVNRIKNLDTKALLDAGWAEQLIEKNTMSPFPQVQMTERPDKAAAAILEGRVVVVVDNSPVVLMLPSTLNTFFQAAEDYYDRWEIMSFIRILRYFAAFTALALPGLYIALTLYNPDLLPTEAVLKIAGTRLDVPFSAVTEIVVMELAFELLREAGIRLPSPSGSALGIVGGIVVGQAAVEAGIVGPVVVIISALSGICTFVVPNQAFVNGIRLTKYIVLALSAFFGMFGFWTGIMLVFIHLCSLESYGIPYMYPYCSAMGKDRKNLRDSIVRLPLDALGRKSVFEKRGSEFES